MTSRGRCKVVIAVSALGVLVGAGLIGLDVAWNATTPYAATFAAPGTGTYVPRASGAQWIFVRASPAAATPDAAASGVDVALADKDRANVPTRTLKPSFFESGRQRWVLLTEFRAERGQPVAVHADAAVPTDIRLRQAGHAIGDWRYASLGAWPLVLGVGGLCVAMLWRGLSGIAAMRLRTAGVATDDGKASGRRRG